MLSHGFFWIFLWSPTTRKNLPTGHATLRSYLLRAADRALVGLPAWSGCATEADPQATSCFIIFHHASPYTIIHHHTPSRSPSWSPSWSPWSQSRCIPWSRWWWWWIVDQPDAAWFLWVPIAQAARSSSFNHHDALDLGACFLSDLVSVWPPTPSAFYFFQANSNKM